MTPSLANAPETAPGRPAVNTVYAVLVAISFAHLLNDTIQALLPSIYPILKSSYHLSFAQLGLIHADHPQNQKADPDQQHRPA